MKERNHYLLTLAGEHSNSIPDFGGVIKGWEGDLLCLFTRLLSVFNKMFYKLLGFTASKPRLTATNRAFSTVFPFLLQNITHNMLLLR